MITPCGIATRRATTHATYDGTTHAGNGPDVLLLELRNYKCNWFNGASASATVLTDQAKDGVRPEVAMGHYASPETPR